MPDIFVSYATQDRVRVIPLVEILEAQGWSVWWDRNLVAGAEFDRQIERSLDEAKCVVVVWSKNSVESSWCRAEASEGLVRKILVPVRLDESHPPLVFRNVQSAMLDEWPGDSGEVDTFLAGVRECLGVETRETRTSDTSSTLGNLPTTRKSALSKTWIAIGALVALIGAIAIYELSERGATTEETPQEPLEGTRTFSSKTSIAVLPFVNVSADPDQEYFSDGISEELLNLLAKNSDLRVISRSSSFTFKGKDVDIPTVAQSLGVDHVLEGSIRKAGDTVRITVQLIDADTDSQLWSETYDRELVDIFAVQDEVASDVVRALNRTLFGAATTNAVDLKAYTLYLHGRHLKRTGVPDNLQAAEEMLKEALVLEPGYTKVWIELADLYLSQRFAGSITNSEAQHLFGQAIEHALNLEPDNADIYALLAESALNIDRDLTTAAEHLERANRLDPANLNVVSAGAEYAMNLGRLAEAQELMEYVTLHDPLCIPCYGLLGTVYLLQEKLTEAATAFDKVSLLLGSDSNFGLAFVQLLQGKYENSLAGWRQGPPGPFRTWGETMTLYTMGRKEDFSAKFRELKVEYGDDNPTLVARVYAWTGDTDRAFEWLDRFHEKHPERGPVIGNFWEFMSLELRSLHDDPRWQAYLRKRGIAPEQLASYDFDVSIPQ